MDALGQSLLSLLRADQRAIIGHPAKRKDVCMGRRWGKTVMCGIDVVMTAMAGYPCAWVAPTYKNSRPLWRQVQRLAGILKTQGIAVKVSEADKIVSFPDTGGWLGVYSGDSPDSLRGEKFKKVIVDEAAKISQTMIEDVIEPTLADLDGTLINISTPSGLNWFFESWQRSNADETGYSAAFTAPTSDNPMPNIQKRFERAREVLPELSFRQEYLAEFLSHSGAVFRKVDQAATSAPITAGEPGRQYVAGLDLGRVTDSTVIIILDVTDEHPREVLIDRWRGIEWQMQLDRIVAIARAFNPSMIAADKTGLGNMPVAELAELLPDITVWGITFNTGNKTAMVHRLAAALERGELAILDDPVHKGELKAYTGKERPSGTVEYSAPAGMHDDTVAALMLAMEAARSASPAGFVNLAA